MDEYKFVHYNFEFLLKDEKREGKHEEDEQIFLGIKN